MIRVKRYTLRELNSIILFNNFLFFFLIQTTFGQTLFNNGATLNAISGSHIYVNGSVKNELGTIIIDEEVGLPSEIFITEDMINNSELIGDGYIRLLGNWYNNASFTSNNGTVFFEGANQLISGSVETNFFNLTLDGSGFKTQEINAFSSGVLDLKHLELQTEVFNFYVENTDLNAIQRTSGFVSSLNGGFLSRRTSELETYLFPVGSSLGTLRYRPVELKPTVTQNNTFEVRLANIDATIDGFDRTMTDVNICELNPLFYHQIDRALGSGPADLNIYFNEADDGIWGGISNWMQINGQWEYILGSSSVSDVPLSRAYAQGWNDFDDIPYILAHINEIPEFDEIPPICLNQTVPELSNISNNGFTGSWSGTIDAEQVGIQNFTFTPNPGQCAQSVEIFVEILPLPEFSSAQMIQEISCNGEEGMIEVNVLGTNIMYGMNGGPMSSNNQFMVHSGMHTMSIMDEYGCMNEMIQEVLEPNPLEMQTSVEHIFCPEGTGAIDLTITGGVPGYNVVWNNTLFSEDASGLEAGSYSGVLTDDNGCQDSVLVEINETLSSEPAYIENASGSAELNCLVTEIEVNAQGGSAFNWSGGTSPNTSWNIFNTPGNYIVDYLDSNGCALQMNILISENINPPLLDIDNITNSTNELNCNEPEIILFGSGADSYIWNDTIQNISTTISSPGEYSVIGIGNNGCIDSTSIIITANFELPNLILQNISGSDTLDCNNTSIDIVASGASNYEWSNGIGTQSTITINEGGTYYITALGDNGCSVQDSIEIIEISFPVLSVNSETICAGNMIELVAEASIPGGTYTWSNNLGSNSSVFVEPISNAVFTVDYILNGCESNTATSIISVLPTPVVSISGVNSICSSQSVSLTGEPSLPGGSFEWFPNGEIEPTITTFPQSSTTYGLSYTLNGCPSDTVEAFVEVIPTPVVTLEDVSICDGESGTLIAQPSITGGTFNWTSSGQNTQSITENPDTTTSYSVIYALNGCLSQLTTASIIVNPIPDLFVADIGICAGQTGVLNAQGSPNGGSFQWTGYIEDESVLEVNPLVTSNYTVTYTLNNCSSSIESAEVTVTEQPVLSTENQGICEGESVVLTAIPSVLGGQYLWLPNNETSETITVSPNTTTTYEVMYTINGCQTDLEPIIVSVDAMPITTFDVNVTSGCAPLNVVFTNTTSNTSGCTWSINDGSTFSGCENMSYTFLNEGCYDVTLVTETPNGCPGIMNMENLICVFPSPNIDFSASTNQISYGSSEVIFSNNSSGAESYFWDFGDGSSDTLYNPNLVEYEVNDETFFTVSLFGISELGCTDSLQLDINVNQDAIIFAPNSFTPDGDGLNDSWYPTISTGIDEDFFSVQIYNRWGELIFEATDFISSWDGTYQGMQSPIGTYTFRIEYKEKQSEKRKIILGHINLIR